MMDDEAFVAEVTERLSSLPGVVAVSLGGSRAKGTHRSDSDWDFAVYYRGGFDPEDLRALGWPGEVFEVGAWGGVFNGGAWLTIEGRRCDVHYRDLAVVEHELDEAAAGRFRVEPLLFHLAGIPTYLVVAELALHRVLAGDLPRPTYPARLRTEAYRTWWARAELTFAYAEQHHAPAGRLTSCVGLLAQATTQAAHAVLAGRGQWTTNEKALLADAGLSDADAMLAAVDPDPAALAALARSLRERCAAEVWDAGTRDDEAGERWMRCEDCGYDFERVEITAVPTRLRAVAGEYASLLGATSEERLRHRPEEAVWSPLEHACHVRDVFLNLRDRILLALVEDRPVFAPIHREERVSLARYAEEPPARVAVGIDVGAELLARLVEGLDGRQRARVGVYAGVERDVSWIARQADHEATHHLLDARRGLGDGRGL